MRVLGIETSCDETGVAIFDQELGLMGHCLHSQIATHAEFGGVVPELASRDHIRKLTPLIKEVLQQSQCDAKTITGIAYTKGPGLVGALLVGSGVARSLAYAWDVPAIGVHHMEGHLLAPLLEADKPTFPFGALLVSGGHTLLVKVERLGHYELLGESVDDAAGEAFDKTAKLLGLSYPGGAALAELAKQGDPTRYQFPRPMVNRPGCDFSFSGLKTFAVNTWRDSPQDEQSKADIAVAFQEAVVDTLVIKCKRALQQTGLQQLVVAGGVAANQLLRMRLTAQAKALQSKVFYPRLEFCTDNGAMIAYAGLQRLFLGEREPLSFKVKPRWSLDELE